MLARALRLVSLAGIVLSIAGAVALLRGGPMAAEAAASPSAAPASVSPTGPTPDSPSPSPTATSSPADDPATADWTACSNLTIGYELKYPNDWYSVSPSHRLECRFFDDQPFAMLAQDTTMPRAALRVYVAGHTFGHLDRVLNGETNTDVISRRNITIAGHRGFVVELMTHSAEFGDSPMYAYVIDLGRDALVMDGQAAFASDYPALKAQLDLVVSTFRFLPGEFG